MVMSLVYFHVPVFLILFLYVVEKNGIMLELLDS